LNGLGVVLEVKRGQIGTMGSFTIKALMLNLINIQTGLPNTLRKMNTSLDLCGNSIMRNLGFSLVLFCCGSAFSAKCQTTDSIVGCYFSVGANTYYIILDSAIVKYSFCETKGYPNLCGYSVSIDKSTYNFENDTLTFNFGETELDKNYYFHRWIYLPKHCRFVDDIGFGEYIKMNKTKMSDLLRPYGIDLRNMEFE